MLIRRIRALLYEQGYTIVGARQQLNTEAVGSSVEPSAPLAIDAAAIRQVRVQLEAVLDVLQH